MDLIVYGATGFTGKRVCLEITKNPPKSGFTWSIAGRSLSKLQQLYDSLDYSRVSRPDIVVLGLDSDLVNELSKYSICINCVGPFRNYGRPIFEACCLAKTNYIDICGETEFIEQMYFDYSQMAIENKVVMVSACGYDSVPADFFSFYVKREMGKCTQMEMVVELQYGDLGLVGNATTFESAVLGFANINTLRELRKNHRKVISFGKKLKVSKGVAWNTKFNRYTIPLQVADVPVIKLGQQIMEIHKELYKKGLKMNDYEPVDVNAVQFAGYFGFKSWIGVLYVLYLGVLLHLGALFKYFRGLLIKYPEFFTLGVFRKSGPSEEHLRQGSFETRFIAKGYSGTMEGEPDMEMVAKVQGPEMGYVTTPVCVVGAAEMILQHRNRIPNGVVTPAVAFSNVAEEYRARLEEGGVVFSVISKKGF